MKEKWYLTILASLLLLVPVAANAAATCANDTAGHTDGRIDTIVVDSTVDQQVFFYATTGHSYSVEVFSPAVDTGSASVSGFVGTAFTNCPTSNQPGFVTTAGTDPHLPSSTLFRGSFISPDNNFREMRIASGGPAATMYYSISDTTLYNPRWSTFSGFITQWGFQNTTNASVSGTLTVNDSVSGGPYTKAVTVPSGATVFVTTSDTFTGGPIPASHAGGAFFAHTGPPGSIKADAYFINASATVIVPADFKPVRENSH
jgi:hypothetical protein